MIVLEKVFSYLQQSLNCSILFRFQCHTVIPDFLKKKIVYQGNHKSHDRLQYQSVFSNYLSNLTTIIWRKP